MIDIHNHVLPALDDGSPNMEVSMNMIRAAKRQGITDIVNTVHFQHPKMDKVNISYEDLISRAEMLQNKINSEGININIHVGAEIFFLPNLLKLVNNPLCTMGNGRYMLIEFQIRKIPHMQKQVLFNLKMKNVTPIIAHPERYEFVQKDINFIYEWIYAGCLIQIDAGSLNGTLGSRAQKSAQKIVRNKLCHLISSDAHNDSNRNFCLNLGLENVKMIAGKSFSNILTQNAIKVFNGEDIKHDFIPIETKTRKLSSVVKNKIWRALGIESVH